MLDLGTHAGLASIGLPVGIGQRRVPVGTLIGKVLGLRRNVLESLPLRLAPIGTVAVEAGFLAMQQIGYFMAVMHVGGGDTGAMNQANLAVRPDVQLHAVQGRIQEVPRVALLGLVHLLNPFLDRVTGLVLILDRGWRRDQRGIDDRATRELHAVGQQQLADLGEQGFAQLVRLQQAAEVKQGVASGTRSRPTGGRPLPAFG